MHPPSSPTRESSRRSPPQELWLHNKSSSKGWGKNKKWVIKRGQTQVFSTHAKDNPDDPANQWTLNRDGTISPASDETLALGVTGPLIALVSRGDASAICVPMTTHVYDQMALK